MKTGAAGKVTLELRQHASARREDDLADAFREVTLTVETEDDRLTLLQDGPFRCERPLLRDARAATGTPTTR